MSVDIEQRIKAEIKEIASKNQDPTISDGLRDEYFYRIVELSSYMSEIIKSKDNGIKEGKELGIKKGKEKTLHKIIKALIDTNHTDEDIINITKCDKKTLEMIKSKCVSNVLYTRKDK